MAAEYANPQTRLTDPVPALDTFVSTYPLDWLGGTCSSQHRLRSHWVSTSRRQSIEVNRTTQRLIVVLALALAHESTGPIRRLIIDVSDRN